MRGQAWLRSKDGGSRTDNQVSPAKKRQALQNVKEMFSGRRGVLQASFVKDLLEQLMLAGYLSNQSVSKIEDFFQRK